MTKVRTGERLDAIVVGGGLAGVTAARDLANSGARTLLVEARDRLGGRTETRTIAGREVDTGGTYFHWFQAALWREVMRYELPVVESTMLFAEDVLLGDAEGAISISIVEFDERLRRGLQAFWGDPEYMAALPRPFAIRTDPRAARLDSVTIDDRLRELDLDPTDERVLRAILLDFGDPAKVSLAWALQRMASAAWSHEVFSTLFAVNRLEGGMETLIDAMVREGDFEVRLSSPVAAVAHDDDGATVTLEDGSELSARAVVVATPVDVWKTISFSPALPEAHRAASEESVVNRQVSNVMMHVRGVPDTVFMIASYASRPFDILATYLPLEDGQLLAGYSLAGGISFEAGRVPLEEALHGFLPEAELVDFVGHDWGTDRFAMGGFGSLHAGQVSRFTDVLDRPVGSLYFANAEIAPQFSGLLSGAIESGARAAHRAGSAIVD